MWLAAVRDVAILLLAITSIVIGILLAVMLVQVKKLISLLREEIGPMLGAAGETVGTVNRTAGFLSENVVAPLIKLNSYAVGTREVARTLLLFKRGGAGSGAGEGKASRDNS